MEELLRGETAGNAAIRQDRNAIEAEQWRCLQTMLETILPANRFYQTKFSGAGIVLPLPDWQAFYTTVPFTTKQELTEDQQANPPYGTDLTGPLEEYTRFHQTSGTSGSPLRWLDTNASWSWIVDNWVEVFRASGVKRADHIYFAFSFGPFLGFWTAFEAGCRLGCLCLPGGGLSSAARLRAILDNAITVLCCTPTYAIRLGEVAEEEGISLANSAVRKILVAGEPGAGIPATRARIERLWPGARLYDHHGMTEVGPVSYECPQRPGVLHILEPRYLAEVIDPETGTAVGPGGQGELVLTNLGRIASPLIRYRTGDLVKRAESVRCVCGSAEMALEGGILGRTDDMVVVRGVNLHPTAVEKVIRTFDRIAEYRVELFMERAMQEVRIQIETHPECNTPEEVRREVETALRAAFNLRVPVTLVPGGSLPRFELKAKRWLRLNEGS